MEFEYIVRMAMPDDKLEIEGLVRQDIEEKNETFEEKRFEWGMLRRIYDPLQRNGTFIAEKVKPDLDKKEFLGIIFSEMRLDPFGTSRCYIKRIFVRKEYRGNLIGQSLLSNLLDHLKSINVKGVRIDLHLNSVNTKALLTKYNFTPKYTIFELDLND